VPSVVDIVLSLPAPTDLPSLERELIEKSLGAILIRVPGLPQDIAALVETQLYEPLDSYFLGTVDGDTVVFGELMSPRETLGLERARISDILRGGGTIPMVTTGSGPIRADSAEAVPNLGA
jgi:hypothetical protein